MASDIPQESTASSEDEIELARIIVKTLNLDTLPDGIDPEARLYGDGLGLDSIDILEISLALSKTYGVQLRADDSDNVKIFSSLRTLNQYVQAHRSK